jgi:UDP-N-acetylmuramoylalanine--D-glutamate ligase
LQLLLEFFDVNTIGVTGTKGKSTTSSLIYSMLTEQDVDTLLLGNIGIPIFDYLEVIKENMIIVLEISSHQLEYITRSPNIAILLNIFEEHLDHYKSKNEYINAKFNICGFQNETDYFIYNADNELISKLLTTKSKINSQKCKITYSNKYNSDKTIYIDNDNIYISNGKQQKLLYDTNNKRNLMGNHNLNNIMFVLAVSEILKLNINKTIRTINNFEPLSHRMEYVGQFEGVHYYNDSIATIPEATINCIESLKSVSTLIIGGMDRGIDFTTFIEYLRKCNVKNIICMPSTGITIGEEIIKNNSNNVNVFKVETLKEAVNLSKKITEKDKICVLSPAAASYGYFKNFKERGEEFKRLVKCVE